MITAVDFPDALAMLSGLVQTAEKDQRCHVIPVHDCQKCKRNELRRQLSHTWLPELVAAANRSQAAEQVANCAEAVCLADEYQDLYLEGLADAIVEWQEAKFKEGNG